MPKPGPRPLKDKPMTASERAKRSQRRRQILSQVAKEHGLKPISGYLPGEARDLLDRFLEEGERRDSLILEIVVQWLVERDSEMDGGLGVNKARLEKSPMPAVIQEAERRAKEEGL